MAYKKSLLASLAIVGAFFVASSVSAAGPAQAPNVYSPKNRATVSLQNPPQLKWDSLDSTHRPVKNYELQLRCAGCDYNLSTTGMRGTRIQDGWKFTVTTNEFSLPKDLKKGNYRFRVRANYEDGTRSSFSQYRHFSLEKNRTITNENANAAPTLVLPRDEQVLTNYPRKATLSWTSVKKADKYEIELACDVCESSQTKWLSPSTYYSTKTTYTTEPLAGDNEFRFRVRAIFDNGEVGAWSRYHYFKYNTSGYKSEVKVTASKSEISVTETVKITATAKNFGDISKIEIYVNGAKAKTCNDTTTCSLTDGPFAAHYNGKVSYYAIAYRDGESRPSIYSSTGYISVKEKSNENRLTKPTITSPVNNASLEGYPANVRFAWGNVANIVRYKVVVECFDCEDNNLWSLVSTQFVEDNWLYYSPRTGDHEYRFRVLPVYGDGGGVWSDYRYFTYNY